MVNRFEDGTVRVDCIVCGTVIFQLSQDAIVFVRMTALQVVELLMLHVCPGR